MPSRYRLYGPDSDFPGSTDWTAYGTCPTCQQDRGGPCRRVSTLAQLNTKTGRAFCHRPHPGRPVVDHG